ncbi:hypothetical protein [Altererythrobacter sp. ZODW24]|uniref:hypothetical protein n=1 Tax=Altererythrobacter sp. ZODW24 TaxID=2185142 RepID=UPI000DF78B3E|nr:hypothetical protein [Altererythrobacter sp. ZODW24]
MGSFASLPIAIAAALLPQAASQEAAPIEISALERGFRACMMQVSQGSYLENEKAELLAQDKIIIRDDPPADVKLMASQLFKAPTYAMIESDEGVVWITSQARLNVCKVTLSDAKNPLRTRLNFSGELFKTKAWIPDKTRSGTQGGLMREAFSLGTDPLKPTYYAMVDGPQVVLNDGAGIQAIITVARIERK